MLKVISGLKRLVVLTCLPYLVLQVVYNGLIITSVSAIQTRYLLTGVDVGVVLGLLDLGSVIMLIVVAFVGETTHKPRWLSVSSVIVGLGGLVFSIPHFITPEYQYKTTEFVNYCGNVTQPDCMDTGLKKNMYIFCFATLLLGGGMASMFTYSITYIDDNTNTRDSSIYISVLYMMSSFGPLIGFVLGGALTELFVEITKDVDIDSSSPFWIGAWWPGYIICGILSILFAIPAWKMPKKLPRIKTDSVKKVKKQLSGVQRVRMVKDLIACPVFVSLTVAVALNQAFVMGFNSFGIKYSESQYGLTTFMASIAYGVTAVAFCTLGHITSAAIMAKWNLEVSGLLKYCIICSFISVISTFAFFFYCSDEDFAGGTVNYSSDLLSHKLELNSSCNAHCGCTADWYNPVRGSDGVVYYSPCYAGCDLSLINGSFNDCSCITDVHFKNISGTATPVKSIREHLCPNVIGFAISLGLAIYSSILTVSPTTQLMVRIFGEDRKSTAFGLQQLIILVIGILPGRVITGKIMDAACVVWSTKCDEFASCKVYKKWDMALYAFILLAAETSLLFLMYLSIYFIHDRKCDAHDEESTNKEQI